jgi:hypothetical protein
MIDRKFVIEAKNPINGNSYTEKDALLLCAKDKAVPAALKAYQLECVRLGANSEHIESIGLLIERVESYQQNVGSKVPDTVGDEIKRCIDGNLTEDDNETSQHVTLIDKEDKSHKKFLSYYKYYLSSVFSLLLVLITLCLALGALKPSKAMMDLSEFLATSPEIAAGYLCSIFSLLFSFGLYKMYRISVYNCLLKAENIKKE